MRFEIRTTLDSYLQSRLISHKDEPDLKLLFKLLFLGYHKGTLMLTIIAITTHFFIMIMWVFLLFVVACCLRTISGMANIVM